MSGLLRVVQIADRLPEELQRAQQRGVRAGALAVTTSIRGEVRRATGGDMRLSGVGLKGARVGARYDVKGQVNPSALIRATGPMQLIEHPTKAHSIKPRKRRKKQALTVGEGKFAAHVQHPGTRPSRPFERGVTKAKDEPARLLDVEVQKAIGRVVR